MIMAFLILFHQIFSSFADVCNSSFFISQLPLFRFIDGCLIFLFFETCSNAGISRETVNHAPELPKASWFFFRN